VTTTSAPVARLLDRLERVRADRGGWRARCPAHDDRTPSLSIAEGDDGRALLFCHAGCNFDEITTALGLETSELFADDRHQRQHAARWSSTRPGDLATAERLARLSRQHQDPDPPNDDDGDKDLPPRGLTLEEYASHFALPLEFLRDAGLYDATFSGRPAVAIPYRAENGHTTATRFRVALSGDRFRSEKGAKPTLYGLPALELARRRDHVVLVEGESDVHVLSSHGIPTLGVPGASTWANEWTEHFEGIETIYVIDEDDRGAETLLADLAASPIAERVQVMRMPEPHRDVADLHRADPDGFAEAWVSAVQGAEPLSDESDPDAELLDLAAQLPPLEYDRRRSDLADRLAIRVGTLDAERRARRRRQEGDESDRQGSALVLTDPEPWPDPVDGADLLTALTTLYSRYLALPPHAAEAYALWTLHAHAHDAADVSPVLAVSSPVMRCGKTTALELIGALVPRPLPAANVTTAALFRSVEAFQPTLLIDEADTFLRGSDELRGVLNSGHRRRSAVVVRTVGDDYEPRTFRTWAPKAIALIGKLPATLADRSIEVRMRRKLPEESVERLRLDRLDDLEPLRRRACRWAADYADRLRGADPILPDGLHDRARDNWRPLLAIADLAAAEWPEQARAAAAALSGAGDDEAEPAGTILLSDLSGLFEERGVDRLASAEIVRHLVTLEHRPWPEWKQGKPLTVRQLARILSPFEVSPSPLWIDGQTRRGYERADLDDALSRYAPRSESLGPQEPSPGAEKSGFPNRKAIEDLTDTESGESPGPARGLTDLTDEIGEMGGEGPPDIARLSAEALGARSYDDDPDVDPSPAGEL